MRRHFLTERLNLFIPIISYFKRMNVTLKNLSILIAFLLPGLSLTAQNYSNIEFIQNKGQWDSRVQYKGDINNGAIFLRSDGFTVLQYNASDYSKLAKLVHGQNANGDLITPNDSVLLRATSYDVVFLDASPGMKAVPDKMLPTYNNYFIGNDPAKWASNCRLYQAVTMKD